MSEKGFTNEYSRVLLRHDLEELRNKLVDAFTWHSWLVSDKVVNEPDCDLDIYESLGADQRFALSVLAMAEYDDPTFIGYIAAGPLEDVFFSEAEVPEEIVIRIEEEARRTPRFRWMLSGVWTSSFKPEYAQRVEKAVAGMKMDFDSLPPRPIP